MTDPKKNLMILADYTDPGSIDSLLLEKCDKATLMPGAMLAFEEKGISYLTFDDFYSYKQFRVDNLNLIKSTEGLFSMLDKKYEPLLNFPRAFTGNIYWFSALFSDIYYISKVCEEIDQIYDKIYIISNRSCRTLSESEIGLEFSSEGLSLSKFRNSIDRKIYMLKTCLADRHVELNAVGSQYNSLNIDKQRSELIPKYDIKKALSKINLCHREKNHGEKRTIFVIQDGYEVSYLKEHMREFLFVNPVDTALSAIKNSVSPAVMKPLFYEELGDFINQWIPKFKDHIFKIFDLYHKNVLCRISFFSEYMNEMFEHYQPGALLYSISSNEIHEDICAYLASKKNIPIFYFQHGGANVSFDNPYQKYFERNANIKKINILQSKVEKEVVGTKVFPEAQALGSAKLFNLYSKTSRRKPPKDKKILYCPVAFNYTYKEMMANCSDKEVFGVNKDVISLTNKFMLKMDIKVSPHNELYNYAYFIRLLTVMNSRNVCVLRGLPVEKIITRYGLFILDYTVTALFPISIILNMPVILYLKDRGVLRQDIIGDLEKRYYLVNNKADLERHISLYASGRLDSKFSLDFIDKYAFPVNAGDPCMHIAENIRNKILC